MQTANTNTVWSSYIHTPSLLAKHRELRFRDENADALKKLLAIEDGRSIIEVGCGPGTLCHKLQQWYPTTSVSGFDIDEGFIEYAQNSYSGVHYFAADANLINTQQHYDYTISHTIFEYMSPDCFFRANNELLKDDGVMIIISNVQSINHDEELRTPPIPLLQAYYDTVKDLKSVHSHVVDRQNYQERDIITSLDRYGFEPIGIHYYANEIIPCNETPEKRAVIMDMYKEIQHSMFVTSIRKYGKIDQERYTQILAEIDSYYDEYSKQLDSKWPLHIDLLRIVKAKKKCT